MSKKYKILISVMCMSLASRYVRSQEKFEVEGAIVIKDSEETNPKPGTIRWNGIDFQGWNGQRWVSLTGNATVGNVVDLDGNVYQTTRIGDQEWMTENLRVTKYNDSTTIEEITDNKTWSELSHGAWSWYDNRDAYENPYGKLYNWYAVNTGKLCPEGWKVPSDSEWTELVDFLGGSEKAANKLKAIVSDWTLYHSSVNNESGFTGLPYGIRDISGAFDNFVNKTSWWSSTWTSNEAWSFGLNNFLNMVFRTARDWNQGISIRCMKEP